MRVPSTKPSEWDRLISGVTIGVDLKRLDSLEVANELSLPLSRQIQIAVPKPPCSPKHTSMQSMQPRIGAHEAGLARLKKTNCAINRVELCLAQSSGCLSYTLQDVFPQVFCYLGVMHVVYTCASCTSHRNDLPTSKRPDPRCRKLRRDSQPSVQWHFDRRR